MSARMSMNEERRTRRRTFRPGSLLRLLAGRRMLLPAERARLASAVARMEDAFGFHVESHGSAGRAGDR